MRQPINNNQGAVLFKKASAEFERGEIERTINELNLNITADKLIQKFNNTPAQLMPPEVWGDLDNTDNTVYTKEDVLERLTNYGRDTQNYDSILKEHLEDKQKEYPALIIKKGEYYYLLAGNTRLMVAMANNIIPWVKIVELT